MVLAIQPREFVALIGASRGGKSALLRHIVGPSAGDYTGASSIEPNGFSAQKAEGIAQYVDAGVSVDFPKQFACYLASLLLGARD
jgi:ABC-type phosphate/phosphonate transport system ATPase subunit